LNSFRTGLIEFVGAVSESEFSWIYTWAIQLIIMPNLLDSPMFLAMPFVGFFAIFMLVDWVNKYFDTKLASHPVFPAIFMVVGLAAYYTALYWYFSNFALLQGFEMSPEAIDFWGKFHGSAFMVFLWGGVFGWIARFVVERLDL